MTRAYCALHSALSTKNIPSVETRGYVADVVRLAAKLKSLRMSRNLKQSDVAQIAGTTQAVVSQWENGKRAPSQASLAKLSAYFGQPMTALDPGGEAFDRSAARPRGAASKRSMDHGYYRQIGEWWAELSEADHERLVAFAKELLTRRRGARTATASGIKGGSPKG